MPVKFRVSVNNKTMNILKKLIKGNEVPPKTPEQVLAEGAAEKSVVRDDTHNAAQKVSVDLEGHVHVDEHPDMFGDVVEFHKKYGIQYDGPPRHPDEVENIKFRLDRTREEMKELIDAYHAKQAPEFLDAHVDLIYILLGTVHLCGYDFRKAWKRVHSANMKKERAHKGNPGKYGDHADIVKPPGWEPPTMTDLVMESVYRPETNLPDTKIT